VLQVGERARAWCRRLTALSPRAVSLIAGLAAAMFAVVRAVRIGGAGAFVVAGSDFADRASLPGNVPITPGAGFDGQFYYRLALDPTQVGMGRHHGIVFDYGVRGGRVAYPALTWVGSLGGRPALVPLMLIVVNVLAVGALGYIAAHLARDRGRAAIWGLAIAGYWGFGFVLARDLAEIVTATGVFGALLLVSRGRYGWASLPAALAVLSREQAVLPVAGLIVGVLVHEWRTHDGRRAVTAASKVGALPVAAFVAWQLAVSRVIGDLPVLAGRGSNTEAPFTAWPGAMSRWWHDAVAGLSPAGGMSLGLLLPLACFVGLLVVLAGAIASGGARSVWAQRPYELTMVVCALAVLTTATPQVLDVPADFRQFGEVVGGAWLLLWGANRPTARRWAAAAITPLTLAVLAFRCVVV